MDIFLVRSIVHGRHNEFQVCINTVDFFFSDPEFFEDVKSQLAEVVFDGSASTKK